MSLKIADRLFETTNSTGSGPFLLQGAVDGFQSFMILSDGVKTAYYIDDADETGLVQNWMAVTGTVTTNYSDTTSLSVDMVLGSSEGGAPVDFGAGVKNVRCGIPARLLAILDENLNDTRHYGAEGGSSVEHLVFLPESPFDYSDGMMIVYRPSFTNTTTNLIVSVNGLGNRSLKINGADPAIGALPAGKLIVAFYDEETETFEVANVQNGLPLSGGNMTGAINEALTTKASAATPDIWTGTGNKINYTGTTTATGFAAAPQAGAGRILICAGACSFTAGANMLIDGVKSGATYTAKAGDRIVVTAITTTQFRLQIIHVDATNYKLKTLFSGYRITSASTANAVAVMNNALINRGSAYDATTGVFTCPRDGDYQVIAEGFGAATGIMSVRKNSTSYRSVGVGPTYFSTISIVMECQAGDTIDLYSTSSLALNNTTPSLTIREL